MNRLEHDLDGWPNCGVYFIYCGVTGLVKIGQSANISTRLSSLRTGSPTGPQMRLVRVHWCEYPYLPGPLRRDGVKDMHLRDRETEYHRRFSAYRVHGEWFRCEGELKDFLGL